MKGPRQQPGYFCSLDDFCRQPAIQFARTHAHLHAQCRPRTILRRRQSGTSCQAQSQQTGSIMLISSQKDPPPFVLQFLSFRCYCWTSSFLIFVSQEFVVVSTLRRGGVTDFKREVRLVYHRMLLCAIVVMCLLLSMQVSSGQVFGGPSAVQPAGRKALWGSNGAEGCAWC